MQSITSKFEVIKSKLKQLISKYAELKKEKNSLSLIIKDLENKINLQKEEINFLQKKNKMRIVKSHLSKNTHESKKMINELIKEIDKCVAHLNH